MDKNQKFRQIPRIDKVLQQQEVKEWILEYGYEVVRDLAREAEGDLRREMVSGVFEEKGGGTYPEAYLSYLTKQINGKLRQKEQKRMQRVINATGVILHTNLGRAPLGKRLVEELEPLMTGYTNLEMDLEGGRRGSRYAHFSESLCKLTGAEAALAVNNNAAAVLVMLSALASGGETIVSRGELVEIGGKFRIPDVCSQSGTTLVEVGTTNRTYLEDYVNAAGEQTAAFLKVHTSNYQITGFTHEVSVEELAEAAHSQGIPLLVDLGSGCLTDLAAYGLGEELVVKDLLKKGADLVSFSGDKLLGGPQAGILTGRKDLIEKIASHPLMRAVRIDKFTAAALEKTIEIYEKGQERKEALPIYEMLGRQAEELKKMGLELLEEIRKANRENLDRLILEDSGDAIFAAEEKIQGDRGTLWFQIVPTQSFAGGGTTPGRALPGIALRMKSEKISVQEISRRFRNYEIPVIGRIEDGWYYLEMRTILPGELDVLKEALKVVFP